MIGIRPFVTQEELNSKKGNIETRGTSKEEFMEGGLKCTNLIEASMRGTNPVH